MTFSKQNVDDNIDYKAGHAISLEYRMISVKYDSTLCLNNEGLLSVVSSGSSGGSTEYIAGKGIEINNDIINTKVDNTTIKINDKNQLEAVNSGGTTYTAGNGININNNTINTKIDDIING